MSRMVALVERRVHRQLQRQPDAPAAAQQLRDERLFCGS
jgi:hypothetical protein